MVSKTIIAAFAIVLDAVAAFTASQQRCGMNTARKNNRRRRRLCIHDERPTNAVLTLAATRMANEGTSDTASPTKPPTLFVSPKYRVYIEDTDAYGVMYNANYLRSYERALSHVDRWDGCDSADDDAVPIRKGGRWVVTSLTQQKFRSSPEFGGEYVIRGEMLGRVDAVDPNTGGYEWDEEVWHLDIVSVHANDLDSKDNGDVSLRERERLNMYHGNTGGVNGSVSFDGIVHNSAKIVITRAPSPTYNSRVYARILLPSKKQPTLNENSKNEGIGKLAECKFNSYHDEFDSYMCSSSPQNPPSSSLRYFLPLRNVMNFFERTRTNALGGPEALRRMQTEDDLLWVVTGIDGGALLAEGSKKDTVACLPGKEVIVETDFVSKRRGMILECRHALLVEADDAENGKNVASKRIRLAEAVVTIMALKGSTRRPTSDLPMWLREIISEAQTPPPL